MCKKGPDWDSILSYKTIKLVNIRSKPLGIAHLLVQLTILMYVVIYSIIYVNGYQTSVPAFGDVSVKIKGVAPVIGTATDSWDAVDAVNPALEKAAACIAVRALVTPGQSQTVCSAATLAPSDVTSAEKCAGQPACAQGVVTPHGVTNGQCVGGFCLLDAWCPFENDTAPALQLDVSKFTIFIRSSVSFVYNGNNIKMSNAACPPPNGGACVPQSGINLFTVNDVIANSPKTIVSGKATVNWTYAEVSQTGGLFSVLLGWDCDLDLADPYVCTPTYTFNRLDDPSTTLSPGFNFRYADYYDVYRDLYKIWAIRIVFVTSGTGLYFDFATLLKTLGAGLGLLTIATLVTDFIALNVLPQRLIYRGYKYEVVSKDNPPNEVELAPMDVEMFPEQANHSRARKPPPPAPPTTLVHPYADRDDIVEADNLELDRPIS